MSNRKIGTWLLLATVCLAFGGCIKGRVLTYATYNKAADSFSFLEVYANIATKEAGELKHITTLWRRKDNLIIDPIGSQFRFLTAPTIFERHGKHGYSRISLADALKKEPEPSTTSVDLDTIQVVPGEFFLNEHKNLCYFHQIVIPGATVDALMRERAPVIAEELAKIAEEDIKNAGKKGWTKMSWDDVRNAILESVGEKKPKPADEKAKGPTLLPLEMASLRLMIKAGADKSVPFTRKADVFTLVLPLSPRDTDEAIATVELARQIVAKRQKAGKTVDKHIVGLLDATNVFRGEAPGLSVTVQLGKLAKLVNADQATMPTPEKDAGQEHRTTIAFLEGQGIEVNKTDQFPIVLKRFLGSDAGH
jgi:hypothetical protein